MSKREVAKRLEQEIAVTKDPKTLIELTRQHAKMQPKQRLRRKRAEKPAEGSKKNRSLREIYTGSVFDALSDEKLVIHHLVIMIENKQRELGRKLTETEKEEIVATARLSFEECGSTEF
jgi:hypothetical protein